MNYPTDYFKMEVATLGGGCFWCIEACFRELKGVIDAYSGYAGGALENPTYEQVCSGSSGHAEVVRIEYDDSVISFQQLLDVFWFIHDPTQLNRQGNDIGTQYRSVIFYHDNFQKSIAEQNITTLSEQKVWGKPIVTEIKPIANFYRAESFHQDYFRLNPNNGYCQYIIRPKFEKFLKAFVEK
jgi:peptide-methionine (S)-S-oxide reductase